MVQLWYPVILVHGFMDNPALTGVWDEAERVLKQHNVVFFRPKIPSYGSIGERTTSLIKQIQAQFPGRPDGKTNYVHIFGHSMGGINARDVAHRACSRNLGFKVKTVTTFGTPHKGVKAIDKYTAGILNEAFATVMSFLMKSDWKAFINLSESYMTNTFDAEWEVSTVRYFSWAGECDYARGLTSACWPFTRKDGPTDGAVNVNSATLERRHGTHLGTFPGTDHLTITKRTEAIENTLKHIDAAEYSDGRTCDVFLSIDNSFGSGVSNHVKDTFKTATAPARTALRIVQDPVQVVEHPIVFAKDLAKSFRFWQ